MWVIFTQTIFFILTKIFDKKGITCQQLLCNLFMYIFTYFNCNLILSKREPLLNEPEYFVSKFISRKFSYESFSYFVWQVTVNLCPRPCSDINQLVVLLEARYGTPYRSISKRCFSEMVKYCTLKENSWNVERACFLLLPARDLFFHRTW